MPDDQISLEFLIAIVDYLHRADLTKITEYQLIFKMKKKMSTAAIISMETMEELEGFHSERQLQVDQRWFAMDPYDN